MMTIGITAIVVSMMPVLTDACAQEPLSVVRANLPPGTTEPFAGFISEASRRFKVPRPLDSRCDARREQW